MSRIYMDGLKLVLGRYDDPENQKQENYWIDLYSDNLAIFGSSMSGKTTLLKTLLIRIHQVVRSSYQEEIYILDFSNNLELYKKLPFVHAYFNALNDENIRRIFKILEEKFYSNIQKLSGKIYTDFEDKENIPHITFILDGLNSFMAESGYGIYQEILYKLARDGLSKGITIIFTANEIVGGVNRLLNSFNRIIAFDLPKDKYVELFSSKIQKPIINRGRGIVNIDINVYEFQCFFPYDSDTYIGNKGEEEALEDLINKLTYLGIEVEQLEKEKLKSFSGELLKENWEIYTQMNWNQYQKKLEKNSNSILCPGIDYYSFMPIEIELQKAQSIAIYGKRKFGKSNLLYLILEAARNIPNVHFVFWEDGRKGLEVIENLIRDLDYEFVYDRKSFEIALMNNGFIDLPSDMNEIDLSGYQSEYSDPFADMEDPLDDILNSKWDKKEKYFNYENDIIDKINKKTELKDKKKSVVNNNLLGKSKYSFTVFVIQSRFFYQPEPGGDGKQLITRMSSCVNNAVVNNSLFVFADVQRIVSPEVRTYFNNSIEHAFLLDDILRFVNDRGKNSVFGSQDLEELKERFGKCDIGDGFYFNLEMDSLTKLRFIKEIE